MSERALRDALSAGGLVCVYQPVYDLVTGHLIAVEALARRHEPETPSLLARASVPH
jgi:EAL domain-containing protein (putative c-di-GMP-specific phosphodiesterase class I)